MNYSSLYPTKWTINRFIVYLIIKALLRHFSVFCEIQTSDWLYEVIQPTAPYAQSNVRNINVT